MINNGPASKYYFERIASERSESCHCLLRAGPKGKRGHRNGRRKCRISRSQVWVSPRWKRAGVAEDGAPIILPAHEHAIEIAPSTHLKHTYLSILMWLANFISEHLRPVIDCVHDTNLFRKIRWLLFVKELLEIK